MARRAFHAASSPAASVPASPSSSPLPSKNGLATLQWLLRTKRGNKVQRQGHRYAAVDNDDDDDDDECVSMFAGGGTPYSYIGPVPGTPAGASPARSRMIKRRGEALSRLGSAVLAVLARARRRRPPLGSCATVTGTIFGRRRGRVHLALQTDPRAPPALLLELAAFSTGALVREMASGLVRLALECEKSPAPPGDQHQQRRPRRQQAAAPLVEEATWRAYCNGRKCGYALRRDCGADEWRVLRAVEPVSVGAGVLPDGGGDDNVQGTGGAAAGEGDLMYMRAKFERVVGSRDSEAFYMVNPDGGSGPELSIYLLRV